jgi:hypothetical protein
MGLGSASTSCIVNTRSTATRVDSGAPAADIFTLKEY